MYIQETEIVKKQVFICDSCNMRAAYKGKCGICEKQLCYHCRICQNYDLWSTNGSGDYPDSLCKSCDKLYKTFDVLKKLRIIEDEEYKRVIALQKEFEKYVETAKGTE